MSYQARSILIHVLATVVAAGALVATLLCCAGDAHAVPDPHIPDPSTQYCPGGAMGSPLYMGFCDGEHYPDGSFWHTRQWGLPLYGWSNGLLGTHGGPDGAECVIDNGTPMPPPAPPGGCNGAQQ